MNAVKMSCAVAAPASPSGRFRENSRETNSTRSEEDSNSALYISCRSMLPRRMSTMNTIRGLTAAMYVKFCSGPTPMYTRPGLTVRVSSGMTYCIQISFDSRLSERNQPSGSDNSVTSFQYS